MQTSKQSPESRQPKTLHRQQHLRPTQTARFFSISLATLWRWAKERDDFPKPRKIGPRVTVWDLDELIAWRDAQQGERQ